MSHERSSGDSYCGIPELFRYCLENSGKEIKFIRQTMEKERSKKGEIIRTAPGFIGEEVWEYDVICIMDADGQHCPEVYNEKDWSGKSRDSAL